MLKYTLPALALLFVGACGGDGKDDTAETGATTGDDDDDSPGDETGLETYTGPTFLDYIEAPWCQNSDAELVMYAETTGWTNGENLINIWEQGASDGNRWHEEHVLESVSFGELGYWDALEQIVATDSTYVKNEASLFRCVGGIPDHSTVVAIRVYDLTGNLADCAIFEDGGTGNPPAGGIEEVFAGDTDTDLPGFVPVTAEGEINSSNCAEWTL